MTVDSYVGTKLLRIFERAVVRMPFVQYKSLIPSGSPSRPAAMPFWMRSSDVMAFARAISGVSSTYALSYRLASICFKLAVVSSTDEIFLAAKASRVSTRVRFSKSDIVLDI